MQKPKHLKYLDGTFCRDGGMEDEITKWVMTERHTTMHWKRVMNYKTVSM